jgi:hypothetical protein
MQKQRVSGHASQTYTECHGPYKSPRHPKTVAIAHKNGHKHKNVEFFVIPLQNVQTVIFLVNLHGTPKQWAIAHKTALKHKNDEFFVMPLKHVLSVMDLVN